MIEILQGGVYLFNNKTLIPYDENLSTDELNIRLQEKGEMPVPSAAVMNKEKARKNTISHGIFAEHNKSGDEKMLRLKFDVLASHDITYVGVVQTARASGLDEFPVPYVLTNCHNSLCAVGGTINEDDHVFGLSAAKKYGGIYVPAHISVIHQYMREMMSSCGSMILGSDSHTRYGALGTMGVGEGGPELVKQLLSNTYDIPVPDVIAVYLKGMPKKGVGPQDVALALIGPVFKSGFLKNKVLEFVGPGIKNLSIDFRNGIDVMTTETTCLSSIWCTDDKVREYFNIHGRGYDYRELLPENAAYYDGAVIIDLDRIEPMIALPFHPSNVYTIRELNENPRCILEAVERECQKQIDNPNIKFNLTDKIINGRIKVEQASVAGCAGGTFENLCEMAAVMEGRKVSKDYFSMSLYPASQPVYFELMRNRAAGALMEAGAVIKTAFCGPCFGAGDIPANNALSIRHTTRNFSNREGSKPGQGQISSVALMDARSIAATAINGGYLTPATVVDFKEQSPEYFFNSNIYKNTVYNGYRCPERETGLIFGPNIADWPPMIPLSKHIVLKVCSVIRDPVTTTDELIPSGESASLRSNPIKLAELTLSRRDPSYVPRAKDLQNLEKNRQEYLKGKSAEAISQNLWEESARIMECCGLRFNSLEEFLQTTGFGSAIFAVKPGDGSAREQAASSQRVLGGLANIAVEYATKRYRSNLINWGIIPFTVDSVYQELFAADQYIFVPDILDRVKTGEDMIPARIVCEDKVYDIELKLNSLLKDEAEILAEGSLINYYASEHKKSGC